MTTVSSRRDKTRDWPARTARQYSGRDRIDRHEHNRSAAPAARSLSGRGAHRNASARTIGKSAIALGARFAAVTEPDGAYPALKAALSGTGIAAGSGEDAVIEAAARPADLIVARSAVLRDLLLPWRPSNAGPRLRSQTRKPCLRGRHLHAPGERAKAPFCRSIPSTTRCSSGARARGSARTSQRLLLTRRAAPSDLDLDAVRNARCASPESSELDHGGKSHDRFGTLMNKGLDSWKRIIVPIP